MVCPGCGKILARFGEILARVVGQILALSGKILARDAKTRCLGCALGSFCFFQLISLVERKVQPQELHGAQLVERGLGLHGSPLVPRCPIREPPFCPVRWFFPSWWSRVGYRFVRVRTLGTAYLAFFFWGGVSGGGQDCGCGWRRFLLAVLWTLSLLQPGFN